MTDPTIPILIVAGVAILLALRVPVGFTLLLMGAIGFATSRGLDSTLNTLGARLFDIGSGYSLSAVPLFLLMGHMAIASRVTEDMFGAARAWVGHLRGSLVLATTFAATGFAACSGSTTSTTAVFGRVALPEMLKNNIDRRLAAGCIATVGTLAGMIPPSVVLIVFGIIARESIPRLFIAGIIPGLLTASCFAVMIYLRVLHNPKLAPPLPPASRSEKFRSLKNVWAALLLAVVVIGGIYAGIFTPTEAGAMGAAGAFLIALFRGRLSFQVLRSVFTETAKTTSVIFIILVGALIFTSYLAVSGTSGTVTEGIVSMDVHPRVLLLMYLVLMLVLGLFIDPISVMFLTVPIFIPPLTKLGMDPIWIGVLVTKSLEIGLITPPVGLNAFVLKSVSPGFTFKEIYHGIWWFLQVELVVLGIIFAFPELALWLPNLMYR